jgi:hypothetical protein
MNMIEYYCLLWFFVILLSGPYHLCSITKACPLSNIDPWLQSITFIFPLQIITDVEVSVSCRVSMSVLMHYSLTYFCFNCFWGHGRYIVGLLNFVELPMKSQDPQLQMQTAAIIWIFIICMLFPAHEIIGYWILTILYYKLCL